MEIVIEFIGIIGCLIGIVYFLLRFIYYGINKSFKLELTKVVKYKYLLLIPKGEEENERERLVRIFANILLRFLYFTITVAVILTFIFVLIKTSK